MRGIILAGGTGSRLFPLTKVTNKHLLPVGRWPMIYHPIRKLVQAGIHDILIVTGTEHMGDVVGLLGSGTQFNARFTYKVQDEPGGIAQALALAEDFSARQRIVVILGDNIFADDITPMVDAYRKQDRGARVALKEVPDPQRFGVAEVNSGQITGIEEKPKNPKSNLCVTGIYMYDERVFEVIRGLKPSARGEFEITDVNNWYIRNSRLQYDVFQGFWSDAGTFESLALANSLVADIDPGAFEKVFKTA